MLAACKIDEHLQKGCEVMKKRTEMDAKARKREALAPCPRCSEHVILREMTRHMEDACAFRLVPCRNRVHGCPAQIPYKERKVRYGISLRTSLANRKALSRT